MRRPTGDILKQPDRTDSLLAAKIKPMERPAWHADQIAGFHFNRDDRPALRMNVKQSPSGDDVSHFIFVMPMLAIKLGQHDFQIGCLRADIDDIRRDISTRRLSFSLT